MVDENRRQPRPYDRDFHDRETPTDPQPRKPIRSTAPSFGDVWTEITGSHTLESDPPAIRWFDRRVGYYTRRIVRFLVKTAWGTFWAAATAAVIGFLTAYLTHKLTGWMGQ